MKFLSFFFVLFLSVACIKTAEQVQREKRIESMSEQMNDSRGLVADLVSQIKDLQSQLDRMNGKIEEMEHRNQQGNPETVKMQESINLLKTQQESENTQLLAIQNELKEQRAFIEKVTTSLSHVGKETSHSKPQKKSAKSDLAHALELIKQDAYAEARGVLEGLIDDPDLTMGDKNKVFFGLGKVEYFTKNYDKGLVYFSKIYSKYPKTSLAPTCLLFIGRSFARMDKKGEAKEAFAKVLEDYPESKEALEAKKEL